MDPKVPRRAPVQLELHGPSAGPSRPPRATGLFFRTVDGHGTVRKNSLVGSRRCVGPPGPCPACRGFSACLQAARSVLSRLSLSRFPRCRGVGRHSAHCPHFLMRWIYNLDLIIFPSAIRCAPSQQRHSQAARQRCRRVVRLAWVRPPPRSSLCPACGPRSLPALVMATFAARETQ